MNQEMFCYQCEQTAGCTGCTGKRGVCGKSAAIARLQDELTGELIGLAGACSNAAPQEGTTDLIIEGLFATLTNVNFTLVICELQRRRPDGVNQTGTGREEPSVAGMSCLRLPLRRYLCL